MLLNFLVGLAAGAILATIIIIVKMFVKRILEKDKPIVLSEAINKEVPAFIKIQHEKKLKDTNFTYNDILNYVDLMRGQPGRFPTAPVVKEKTNEKMPYYLFCGERIFCLIFVKGNNVTNLILRINPDKLGQYNERYNLREIPFSSSDNWYMLTIDKPCGNKLEIYNMLDECYDYSLVRYYFENDQYDYHLAKIEHIAIEKQIAKEVGLSEKSNECIEKEYRAALKKFQSDYFSQGQTQDGTPAEDRGIFEKEYKTALERFKLNYLLNFNFYK
ncbi:MAG: hypothetical protein FWG51_00250 [Firmicutes bacterium]|nr:hypothetical protein [Bacillota bacterium]